MNILALDTTTLLGSVAVVSDGVVLAESSTRVRATHSEEILPVIHDVLTRAKTALSKLDAIAVGIGPGSFTGVRIGLATARGLQIATGIQLFGVSSLDALAASAWSAPGCVVCVLDARRGEVFASLYDVKGGDRERLIGPLAGTPESVAARVNDVLGGRNAVVVGDLDAALRARFGAALRYAPSVAGTPQARFLAHEVEAGRALKDDGAMEPLYLRDIDAKLPAVAQVVS